MPVPVAREEDHLAIPETAERERAGRLAIRRPDRLAPGRAETRELRKPAAADDGEGHCFKA